MVSYTIIFNTSFLFHVILKNDQVSQELTNWKQKSPI